MLLSLLTLLSDHFLHHKHYALHLHWQVALHANGHILKKHGGAQVIQSTLRYFSVSMDN